LVVSEKGSGGVFGTDGRKPLPTPFSPAVNSVIAVLAVVRDLRVVVLARRLGLPALRVT